MAQKHAGFAVVNSISEALINDLIEAAFANQIVPSTFQLPSPQFVPSGLPVTVSGPVTILPPQVSFVRRADNRATVTCRMLGELRLAGATPQPMDVLVEFRGTALVGLAVNIVNDRFEVSLDLSGGPLTAVSVRVLEGQPLVRSYAAALSSGAVLNALNSQLAAIPSSMLRTTVTGFPATTRVAPRQMPCGTSLFEEPEMFNFSFAVSRVVPRVLDHALSFGLDIAGITQGDPAGLESLLGIGTPVMVQTTSAEGGQSLRQGSLGARANVAASVNPDAVLSLLERIINPAIQNTFVNCHVALHSFGLRFGMFTPALTVVPVDSATAIVKASFFSDPGRDQQLRLTPGGLTETVAVELPFAILLQTWDGDTAFLSRRQDYWFVKIYEPSVSLPWWLGLGVVLIGMNLPFFWVALATLLDGILPSLVDQAMNEVQKRAQKGINGKQSELGLGAVREKITLPRLPNTAVERVVHGLSFTGQGIDARVSYLLTLDRDTRPDRNLTVTVDGTKVREGDSVSGSLINIKPVRCSVTLANGLVDQTDVAVRVLWEVRRTDTKEVVLQQDKTYARVLDDVAIGGLLTGPPPRPSAVAARNILIDRTDPTLSTVSEFEVFVRVYRPLSGRVKEYGSCRFKLDVKERIDRRHPFVFWEGWAAGQAKRSTIHRTALPGRCLMVWRASRNAAFTYLDELPFPLEELNQHRDQICEYCFFGGPDKTTPLI